MKNTRTTQTERRERRARGRHACTYMHAYLLHLYVKSLLEEGGCHTCCPLEICCGRGTPNDNQWTPNSHRINHKHLDTHINKKHKQSLDIGMGINVNINIDTNKHTSAANRAQEVVSELQMSFCTQAPCLHLPASELFPLLFGENAIA